MLVDRVGHRIYHWYQPAFINRVVDLFPQILRTPEKQNGKSAADRDANL